MLANYSTVQRRGSGNAGYNLDNLDIKQLQDGALYVLGRAYHRDAVDRVVGGKSGH